MTWSTLVVKFEGKDLNTKMQGNLKKELEKVALVLRTIAEERLKHDIVTLSKHSSSH